MTNSLCCFYGSHSLTHLLTYSLCVCGGSRCRCSEDPFILHWINFTLAPPSIPSASTPCPCQNPTPFFPPSSKPCQSLVRVWTGLLSIHHASNRISILAFCSAYPRRIGRYFVCLPAVLGPAPVRYVDFAFG